jgi:glycosyltransferase involved in cell wall biosynthesis
MNPEISVITPTRSGDNLLRCYAGLAGQSVADWEWIVVDHGAAQPIAPLLEGLDDERIKIVTVAKGSRGGAARQAGLAAASGDFIAVQEPADWSLPQRFETQLARLEADADTDVVGSFMYVNVPGCDVALWRSYDDAMIHPTLLMRRNVADTIAYDPAAKAGEDHGFTKQVDSQFKWVFVEDLLGVHNVDLGFRTYLDTQLAVWRYERSQGASPKQLISSLIRIAVYGLASLARQSGKLVRRRFNDLTPEQVQAYEQAKAAIDTKVAELR